MSKQLLTSLVVLTSAQVSSGYAVARAALTDIKTNTKTKIMLILATVCVDIGVIHSVFFILLPYRSRMSAYYHGSTLRGTGAGQGQGHLDCSRADAAAPCKVIGTVAAGEMNQMRCLNDKLASYLTRIRGLETQGGVDTSGYRDTIRLLDQDMNQLKQLYEGELVKLRWAEINHKTLN